MGIKPPPLANYKYAPPPVHKSTQWKFMILLIGKMNTSSLPWPFMNNKNKQKHHRVMRHSPLTTSGYQTTCMTHYQMQSHHFIARTDYYQNDLTWFPFIPQHNLVVSMLFRCQVILDLEKGLVRCTWI